MAKAGPVGRRLMIAGGADRRSGQRVRVAMHVGVWRFVKLSNGEVRTMAGLSVARWPSHQVTCGGRVCLHGQSVRASDKQIILRSMGSGRAG